MMKLKPCPFCGYTEIELLWPDYGEGYSVRVVCPDWEKGCGATIEVDPIDYPNIVTGPWRVAGKWAREAAVKLWNRRTE
jgi:hypothetical protein